MGTKKIVVNDLMQQGYSYLRTEPIGENFHSKFAPELTPQEMLQLGVFGGKYMTDCQDEFPKKWFKNAKLNPLCHDKECNFFKVNASMPLAHWQKKGWIYPEDPRGWFQWYCRYFMGRRCEDDLRQIQRWYAIRRHRAQLQKNCLQGLWLCRPKQRQTLLNWSYDSRNY